MTAKPTEIDWMNRFLIVILRSSSSRVEKKTRTDANSRGDPHLSPFDILMEEKFHDRLSPMFTIGSAKRIDSNLEARLGDSSSILPPSVSPM